MYFLPAIPVAQGAWRFPLVEPTAARLLACMGAAHERNRFEHLADTIAADPALALWTALRAGDAVGSASPDSLLLAAWLGPRLAQDLAAGANGSPLGLAYDKKTAERAADSVYRSLIVARVARELAPLQHQESAYLLGLLSEAPLWGELALGSHFDIPAHLPGWLQRSLAEVAQTGGGSPAAVAVRGAQMQLRVATERSVQTQAAMIEERQLAEKVRWEWIAALSDAPAPGARAVPYLAAQLAAANVLQAEFADRLHEEKLNALRELAYGATHEINNPLANISARAESLLGEETHPERRRLLETMRAQALRAHEMIADLMHFARPPKGVPELVALAPLVAQVLHEYAADAKKRHTELANETRDALLTAWIDRTQLAVALGALVRNALEAIGQNGKVIVRAAAEGEFARVEVIDNGPGFPPQIAAHLFDPFFSGREAGRGLGFGLTKAWRIMQGCGGSITGENLPGGGARFVLRIPRQGTQANA